MKYWAFSSHLKSHESHEQINSLKVRALYYVPLNMIISFIQIPLFTLQKKLRICQQVSLKKELNHKFYCY